MDEFGYDSCIVAMIEAEVGASLSDIDYNRDTIGNYITEDSLVFMTQDYMGYGVVKRSEMKQKVEEFRKTNPYGVTLSPVEMDDVFPPDIYTEAWQELYKAGLITLTPANTHYGQRTLMMQELINVRKEYAVVNCPLIVSAKKLIEENRQATPPVTVSTAAPTTTPTSESAFWEAKDDPEVTDDNADDIGDDIENTPVDDTESSEKDDKKTLLGDEEEDDDVMSSDTSDSPEEPENDDLEDTPISSGDSDDDDIFGGLGDDSSDSAPVEPNDDDIMSVELDLRSNTMLDVLPMPPSGAAEAIPSNSLLDTQITSGFDDEGNLVGDDGDSPQEDDLMSSHEDELLDEAVYDEGISLGGADDPDESAPDEDASSDSKTSDGEETPVTAAVRSKVADVEPDDDDIMSSSIDGDESSGDGSKDAVMKKLSSITKGIEDAKTMLLSSK